MKPSSCKAKGRLLQQTVRDKILEAFPSLTDNDVRSTSMGAGGTDVQLSQQALSLAPIAVECKSIAAFAGYKFYDQAIAHAKGTLEPVVVVKANRRNPIAIISLDYLMELLKR